jgi:hypothetical protein
VLVEVEHRDGRPADVEAGVDVVTLVDAEFVNRHLDRRGGAHEFASLAAG